MLLMIVVVISLVQGRSGPRKGVLGEKNMPDSFQHSNC